MIPTLSTNSSKPRRRRCGACARSKVRLLVDVVAPGGFSELELALLDALEDHASGRTKLALARELHERVDVVATAVARLFDLGILGHGLCDAPAHRMPGREASGRCRVHGGASTGAKTQEGRARLVEAGRRGAILRWHRVNARPPSAARST